VDGRRKKNAEKKERRARVSAPPVAIRFPCAGPSVRYAKEGKGKKKKGFSGKEDEGGKASAAKKSSSNVRTFCSNVKTSAPSGNRMPREARVRGTKKKRKEKIKRRDVRTAGATFAYYFFGGGLPGQNQLPGKRKKESGGREKREGNCLWRASNAWPAIGIVCPNRSAERGKKGKSTGGRGGGGRYDPGLSPNLPTPILNSLRKGKKGGEKKKGSNVSQIFNCLFSVCAAVVRLAHHCGISAEERKKSRGKKEREEEGTKS